MFYYKTLPVTCRLIVFATGYCHGIGMLQVSGEQRIGNILQGGCCRPWYIAVGDIAILLVEGHRQAYQIFGDTRYEKGPFQGLFSMILSFLPRIY
jgi:hypothetical protein